MQDDRAADKRVITVRMGQGLLGAIDKARGLVAREAWIRLACELALPREPDPEDEAFHELEARMGMLGGARYTCCGGMGRHARGCQAVA